MECSKSSCKRENYTSTILPQETRKIQSKKPNITTKHLERERKHSQLVEGRKP